MFTTMHTLTRKLAREKNTPKQRNASYHRYGSGTYTWNRQTRRSICLIEPPSPVSRASASHLCCYVERAVCRVFQMRTGKLIEVFPPFSGSGWFPTGERCAKREPRWLALNNRRSLPIRASGEKGTACGLIRSSFHSTQRSNPLGFSPAQSFFSFYACLDSFSACGLNASCWKGGENPFTGCGWLWQTPKHPITGMQGQLLVPSFHYTPPCRRKSFLLLLSLLCPLGVVRRHGYTSYPSGPVCVAAPGRFAGSTKEWREGLCKATRRPPPSPRVSRSPKTNLAYGRGFFVSFLFSFFFLSARGKLAVISRTQWCCVLESEVVVG
ncbi:hypothetical protein GE09DRAFT_1072577 [Coniochaeta sp. 2T2.1]|nr:hypothetical protein GE09DRAFT_1072577 [Coniochaeta sp. 2T2.1]